MLKYISAFLVFLFIFTASTFAQTPTLMIDTSATNKYVRVYFESGSEEIAQICVDIANEHIDWINNVKGIPFEQIPVPIFLYSNRQSFLLSQVADPQNAEGITFLWNPKIMLYFNGSYRDLKHVLTHELNHFVTLDYVTRNYKQCIKSVKDRNEFKKLWNIASEKYDSKHDVNSYFSEIDEPARKYFSVFLAGNLPLWFMEGVAEAWSNPYKTQMHSLIRDVIIWRGSYNIWELNKYPSFITIYKMGESIVDYMEMECGDLAVKTFLDYACTKSIDSTIAHLFGYEKSPIKQLNKNWRKYLYNRYQTESYITHVYLDCKDTLNVGIASWAPINGKMTYAWNQSQVRITDGKKVYASDHNDQNNSLGILVKNASADSNYLIYSSLRDRQDVITIYDLQKQKVVDEFAFENITNIYSPVYYDNTVVFIGQNKNGFKNICIKNGNKYYRALKSQCDIESLVAFGKFIYFIGDYEETGVYDLYVYIKDTHKVARLTQKANARDLEITENGKALHFVIDYLEYNYIGVYDLSNQILYISYPIAEYVQFPYWGGSTLATVFANGAYHNYEIKVPVITVQQSYAQWANSWSYVHKNHKIEKAKFKWLFTISPVIVQYNDYFGMQGEGALSIRREDGTKEYQFALSGNGVGLLKAWHQPWKTQFVSFQWYNLYRWYTSRKIIKERSVNIMGGYKFKPSKYSEAYTSLSVGNRRRSLYLSWYSPHRSGIYFQYPKPNKVNYVQNYLPKLAFSSKEDLEYGRFSRGWVSNIYTQFYYDNTRYSDYWAPLAGKRFYIASYFDVDYTNNKIVDWKNELMYTRYINLGDPSHLALRVITGHTIGAYPHRYELGGPTSFRGYEWMSLYVKHFWLTSAEFRFPFAYLGGAFSRKGGGFFLHHLKLKFFGDMGQVWDDKPDKLLWSLGFGLSGWFQYMPVNLYWVYNPGRSKLTPFLSISYDF